ncbi:MAG: hypothetical protein K2N34_09475 [Lachnospiraceae bacterium]|nr:hypothetical protein [Lachnospiraceae bacterium]
MKSTNKKSISASILKAIEVDDTEAAQELMELWDSKIQLGIQASLKYYYTKLQVLLKCYEQTKDLNAKVRYLHDSIETGNKFFAMNEADGFPMDSEVRIMWFTLVDLSAEFITYCLEGTYDEESEYEDCEEESIEGSYRILSEAIWARIGKIDMPNFKP